MPLTLGFLTSVLILLPGLVALATFNLRVGRAGARRPEQSLTAISALVAVTIVAVMTHYVGWVVAAAAIDAAIAIHDAWHVDLGPAVPNPIATFFTAVTNATPITPNEAIAPAALLLLEVFAIIGFVGSDSFDLLVDRMDWSGQGWVFQHNASRPERLCTHRSRLHIDGGWSLRHRLQGRRHRRATRYQWRASISRARTPRAVPKQADEAGKDDPESGFELAHDWVGQQLPPKNRMMRA
ncbi:hypothetical protein HNO88_002527 [Novosphingobium chloroacetimidivorans]|uniref:Uncharacterized protein n=1 Tax=Novosphingobium chloroacetimidivorans TaxID=1428314 RepID=A0A7W7KBM6_9SPHN|nr:hypothetical protein [Novosphingobium chloroacetimidivorans]MBB4859198.1 hypothetical protein [Novosphingobium chloroacetimidivorans]